VTGSKKGGERLSQRRGRWGDTTTKKEVRDSKITLATDIIPRKRRAVSTVSKGYLSKVEHLIKEGDVKGGRGFWRSSP